VSRSESFATSIVAFSAKTKTTLDEAHRGIVLETFSSIISDTPVGDPRVDEHPGRARANWQTNVGQPRWTFTPALGVEVAFESLKANLGKAGDTVWLSNGLPYIETVEYGGYPNPPRYGTYIPGVGYVIKSIGGYSKQAPEGMVRRAIVRVDGIVKQVAAGLRK
jgi:hypothetical protein